MSYGRDRAFTFSDPDSVCWQFRAPCGVPREEWAGADAVASLEAVRFQVARYREAKPDSDGDNFVDPVDAFPMDPSEWQDTDGDGIGNVADTDDDNDSVLDVDDRFPLDPLEWSDADSDGIGDNSNAERPDDQEEGLVPDPVLRSLIEETLNIGPGATLTVDDIKSLTELRLEQHYDPRSGVSSLEGLQHAVELSILSLSYGTVADLSPISTLYKLRELYLSNHQLQDISPLSSLQDIEYLDLGGNQITDLSPLAGMRDLVQLNIGRNALDEKALEIVSSLTHLTYLNFGGQNGGGGLRDFAALANLQRLTTLHIGGHQELSDISFLSKLPNLGSLYLFSTNVSELDSVRGLLNLTDVDIRNTTVADISPLKNLVNLRYISLSNTDVTSLQALENLPKLSVLDFGNNWIEDLSLLSDLSTLAVLNLDENRISDISELIDTPILSDGAYLYLRGNPLTDVAIHEQIPQLESRIIQVYFDAPSAVPDESLQAALAEAVDAPGSAIGNQDFWVIYSLDLSGQGIGDLKGLELAKNLMFVNIADNEIRDLSPLLDLPRLRQVTLDTAALNDQLFEEDLDALREKGVIISKPATADDFAKFNECQPGMLLGPGEDCTYPNSEERFLVLPGSLAKFLFGTFAGSLEVDGAVGDSEYHLVASREGGTDWRIERVAGQHR